MSEAPSAGAIEYLDLQDALLLVEVLGAGPLKDAGLLDSALSRPRSSAFGQDAYPTVEAKAAALLHSVAKNHALVDGNKRLAWLATTVFLDLNGSDVVLTDDEAFDLVVEVAGGRLDDVRLIAERLRTRRHQVRTARSPSPAAARAGGGAARRAP